MRMSSKHLEAFRALAQTKSFSRAADQLHVTQSALSQRIALLEEELAVTLLIRDKKGLRFTEAGERLIQLTQVWEHLENEFLQDLRGEGQHSGEVRIAGFSSVMRSLVLPTVQELSVKYPQVQVNLLIRQVRDLAAHLRSSEADWIVTLAKIDREDVQCELVGYEQNVMIQKKNYGGPDIFLDHDAEDPTTLEYFREFPAKKVGRALRRRYVDDVYGILDGVKLGLGRAIFPRHMLRGEAAVEILQPRQVYSVPVYLCSRKLPYYSRLQTDLQEALMTALSGGLKL